MRFIVTDQRWMLRDVFSTILKKQEFFIHEIILDFWAKRQNRSNSDLQSKSNQQNA